MRGGPDLLARQAAALEALGFRRAADPEVASETVPVSGGRFKVTCARPSMGTLVTVTGIHASAGLVEDAAGEAFLEMDRVVDLLNRYDSSSAVSYLNAEGSIRGAPPELTRVLRRALFHHGASGGAFDPTVQPVVDLLRAGGGTGAGGGSAMADALARVGADGVLLQERGARFTRDGMGVTLDGIAKGYVVDRVARALERRGVKDFLVNAGGDIRARGLREDGEPWRVGIQDPTGQGVLPDPIPLSGMAVATSGGYEIRFDPEGVHHHIVTPASGASPHHVRSTSVLAPSALDADALATALFVLEPAAGLALIDSLPGCACLVVDHAGRLLRSAGWPRAHHLSHPRGSP